MSVVDTAWEIKQQIPVIAFISGKEKSLQRFISTVVPSVKDCIFAECCRGQSACSGGGCGLPTTSVQGLQKRMSGYILEDA